MYCAPLKIIKMFRAITALAFSGALCIFQPREVFREIDPEPLGAASLAQVHKAVLADGTTVAVKVNSRTLNPPVLQIQMIVSGRCLTFAG